MAKEPVSSPGREGKGEQSAPSEQGKRARTSAWLFSAKAAMATVGGGLLTLIVTIAQVTYQQHLEVLDRQSEQGNLFQAQLFQATGHIENELIDIFNILSEHQDAPVDDGIHNRLDRLSDQWRLTRLTFRVRGAQIYGRTVGNLVYDPSEEVIDLDGCNVQIQRGDRAANSNCAVRRRAEAVRLTRLVASLRSEGAQRGEAHWRPVGFQSKFRLTRKVLHAYADCRIEAPAAAAAAAGPADPKCERLGDTLLILARRIDLLVLAREALSTQIMRSSALRD